MKKLPLIGIMSLCIVLLLAAAGYCAPKKQVYLKDGGIIECRSFGLKNGKITVVVNRDVVLALTKGEVDMKRTFAPHPRKKKHKKPATGKPGVTPRLPAKPLPAAAPAAPKQGVKAPPPKIAAAAPQKAGGTVAAPAPHPAPAVQGPAPAQPRPSTQVPAPPKPKPVAQVPAPPQPKPAAQAPAPAPAVRPPLKLLPPPAETPPHASPVLAGMLGFGALLPFLLLLIIILASLWMVFVKAGEAGWKGIIPVYNVFVLVKIAGKPWWWFLLLLIPGVNIIIAVLLNIALAARFGKGVLFGLGLTFFGFIFFPVLAIGKAVYR